MLVDICSDLEDSVIVGNNRNYLRTLRIWLSPVARSVNSAWKLCWRAYVDGWASSTFHSRCDGKGPTVTIIRVGKYMFGGYTSVSWGKLLLLRQADPGVQIVERGLRMVGGELRKGNEDEHHQNYPAFGCTDCFFTFLRSYSSLTPPLILSYHHYFLNLKTILIISKLHLKLKSTYTAINIIIIQLGIPGCKYSMLNHSPVKLWFSIKVIATDFFQRH